MNNTTLTTLPEKVVSAISLNEKLGEFKEKFKILVNAYSQLPHRLGTEAIPENPKEISAEKITLYVEKMKSGLRPQQEMVWNNLLSTALENVQLIRQFFKSFPNAEFEVDSNVSTPFSKRLKCKNFKEILDEASEVELSQDCRDYFEKICSLSKTLDELRKYENEHGLMTQPAEEIAGYAIHADQYAQSWLSGHFNKKR